MEPDPQMLQQMLAQLEGGGGAPPAGPPAQGGGNWLVEAINAVHTGMVEETDPKQVSLLGKVIDLLTTFQATSMAPKTPGG